MPPVGKVHFSLAVTFTSKSNYFTFDPNCIKVVTLVKFPETVH